MTGQLVTDLDVKKFWPRYARWLAEQPPPRAKKKGEEPEDEAPKPAKRKRKAK